MNQLAACECPSGFTSALCNETVTTGCLATPAPCSPLVNCTDLPSGGHECGPCPAGYAGDPNYECVEDLCLTGAGCQQECAMVGANFSCSCRAGFLLNSTDLRTCDDVDECSDVTVCNSTQVCVNSPGSYA